MGLLTCDICKKRLYTNKEMIEQLCHFCMWKASVITKAEFQALEHIKGCMITIDETAIKTATKKNEEIIDCVVYSQAREEKEKKCDFMMFKAKKEKVVV